MGHSKLDAIRAAMRSNAIADEDEAVKRLTGLAALDGEARAAVSARAAGLVDAVRGAGDPAMMESFLAEYGLSSREGVALMCLAEALLRVPDAETMDELIRRVCHPGIPAVDADDLVATGEQTQGESGADEAGTAGDEYFHDRPRSVIQTA